MKTQWLSLNSDATWIMADCIYSHRVRPVARIDSQDGQLIVVWKEKVVVNIDVLNGVLLDAKVKRMGGKSRRKKRVQYGF